MENVNLKVAQRLKTLRQEKAWSLDLASQKTGVSKAMLGQIERGESSPTIATLWKIATGFEVSFSSFVEEPISFSENLVHRKQELQHLHQDDSLIKVLPIFPFDEKMGFEVFVIQLLPGCLHLSPPHQKGVVEHIIPVQGTIDIEVKGAWHEVFSGQGFRFAADTPHAYRNLSHEPTLFHDIIYYGNQ
jgi:transcriptional regulator with XRE-family HTH domain